MFLLLHSSNGESWRTFRSKVEEIEEIEFRKMDKHVCFVQNTSVSGNIDVQTKWYNICKGATCYVVA